MSRERWTMIRRRDWSQDYGSVLSPHALAPEPDDLEVVALRDVRAVLRDAAAEYAGTGNPGDVLISQAMFQSLGALDVAWPATPSGGEG